MSTEVIGIGREEVEERVLVIELACKRLGYTNEQQRSILEVLSGRDVLSVLRPSSCCMPFYPGLLINFSTLTKTSMVFGDIQFNGR